MNPYSNPNEGFLLIPELGNYRGYMFRKNPLLLQFRMRRLLDVEILEIAKFPMDATESPLHGILVRCKCLR